jgi:hypothetical protein
MVLLSFSEPSHVNKILNGSKRQTTRQERKDPLTPGDYIQLYYKPRMRKRCRNCIVDDCAYSVTGNSQFVYGMLCSRHVNFFGEAVVIGVEHINFSKMDAEALEDWAQADGFDSWQSAAIWFTGTYSKKLENWRTTDWVVITWDPDWPMEAIRA